MREHGIEVEIIHLVTAGDVTQGSLAAAGGEGLFTKRIQQALLDHEVDLAVHSLKDLPTDPVPGLALASVPIREEPFDVMVSNLANTLAELPAGAVVGTGSIRRQAQLLNAYPHLKVADIRGNVETRLAKIETDDYDAVILAHAGIHRLGLASQITQQIPFEIMLPAVGQAALGLESRDEDSATMEVARLLDHSPTHASVVAERTLLRKLRAGCLAPVGCLVEPGVNETLSLRAVVLSPDGTEKITLEEDGSALEPVQLGETAAEKLLAEGAEALINR